MSPFVWGDSCGKILEQSELRTASRGFEWWRRLRLDGRAVVDLRAHNESRALCRRRRKKGSVHTSYE